MFNLSKSSHTPQDVPRIGFRQIIYGLGSKIKGKLLGRKVEMVKSWKTKGDLNFLDLNQTFTTKVKPQNKLEGLDLATRKQLPDGNSIKQMHKRHLISKEQERTSKESSKYNAEKSNFFSMPGEVHAHIFDFLDEPKDLVFAKRTCKSFITSVERSCLNRTAEAAVQIKQLLKFAHFFNDQIAQLTNGKMSLLSNGNEKAELGYNLFKFDIIKWSNIAKIESATRADELVQECYLDLIEALAEYNIDSGLIEKGDTKRRDGDSLDEFKYYNVNPQIKDLEKNRFINKLQLPDQDNENSKIEEILFLEKILNQAKKTLKADMFIVNVYPNCRRGRPRTNTYDTKPNAECWFLNPESANWESHFYYRFRDHELSDFGIPPCTDGFPLELLIGKREGERLVLKSEADEGQVILRCNQRKHRYGPEGDFETVLTKGINTCFNRWAGSQNDEVFRLSKQNWEVYVKQMKDAYGDKVSS